DRNDPAAATFLIVGGGPTGVELAGEIRRLADEEMRDAPLIPRVILVEHTDRLLPGFATRSSMAAERQLDRLGVEVRLESALKRVDSGQYVLQGAQGDLELDARTVVWAAGVHPAPVLGGLTTGEGERLRVDRRCEVEGLQGVYAIGDAAHFEQRGRVLPWIAPVALQQGAYIGRAIARRALGRRPRPFRYVHRGMIAHVGDRAAVGEVLGVPLSGLLPWALGEIVHLAFLPGLENRLLAAGDFLATTLGRRRRPSTLSRGVNVRFDAARGDFDEATLH
ncbi:MAG: FAD-dependent oxidoreductase, partial [Myxococcota bacterium]